MTLYSPKILERFLFRFMARANLFSVTGDTKEISCQERMTAAYQSLYYLQHSPKRLSFAKICVITDRCGYGFAWIIENMPLGVLACGFLFYGAEGTKHNPMYVKLLPK